MQIKYKCWYRGHMYDRVNLYIEPDYTRVEIVKGRGNNVHTDTTKAKLLQFTGLLDKNGNEIYEGDVIQVSRGYRKTLSVIVWEQPVVRYDHEKPYEDLNGYVQFGRWMQKGVKGVSSLAMHEGNFEIIGNIYEHPHLLD